MKINISLSAYQKFIIALGITSIISLIIGWKLGQQEIIIQRNKQNIIPSIQVVNNQPESITAAEMQEFWEVWNIITTKYLEKEKITKRQLLEGAKAGLVQSLDDPYSVYLTKQQNKNAKEDLGGRFEGIGIEIGFNKEKLLTVIAPLSGSPAEKAGLRAGDIIWQIDEKETFGMSIPQAVELIRGKKGTQVKLKLQRENGEFYEAAITRDTITIKSVETKELEDNKIIYVKISRFGDQTESEWNEVVAKIQNQGYKKMIIDVRNNPGGYLETAKYINSDFISGVILQQEDYKGNRQQYVAERPQRLKNIKIAILINKGTASAAEILAGALQDKGMAKLVGENSFGKGTIQEVEDLKDGTGIHITTAKWLLPSGKWVHKTGLKPDYEIKISNEDILNKKDPQLDKAIEILK